MTTCDALVLILEDDPVFRAILLEVLQSEGLQVRACNTFEGLRTAAGGSGVGLIVADCWGASQSRLDSVERHQISELARQAPTILLTGRDWARQASAAELSVAAILCKPIDFDRFLTAVWLHLRKTELVRPFITRENEQPRPSMAHGDFGRTPTPISDEAENPFRSCAPQSADD